MPSTCPSPEEHATGSFGGVRGSHPVESLEVFPLTDWL